MFTEEHRKIIIESLDDKVASYNRSKAKQPKFAEVIDREITLIRETQAIVKTWATKSEPAERPEGTKK